MGAHFEALDESVLLVPLDPRDTQVGFNLVSVQVWCKCNLHLLFVVVADSFAKESVGSSEGVSQDNHRTGSTSGLPRQDAGSKQV